MKNNEPSIFGKLAGTATEDEERQTVKLTVAIPEEIKQMLTIGAAKMAIEERRKVTVTEYLITLIKNDYERNN